MMFWTAVAAVVLLDISQANAACPCAYAQSEIAQYCQAHHVVAGKIISENNQACPKEHAECTLRTFSFEITKVLKNPQGKSLPSNIITVETAATADACGKDFQTGTYYVIGGIVRNNKVWASMCDLANVIPKNELTETYERILDYQKTDPCQNYMNFHGQAREVGPGGKITYLHPDGNDGLVAIPEYDGETTYLKKDPKSGQYVPHNQHEKKSNYAQKQHDPMQPRV